MKGTPCDAVTDPELLSCFVYDALIVNHSFRSAENALCWDKLLKSLANTVLGARLIDRFVLIVQQGAK